MNRHERNHVMIPDDVASPYTRNGIGYNDKGREAELYRRALRLDSLTQEPTAVAAVAKDSTNKNDTKTTAKPAPQKQVRSLHPKPCQTVKQKTDQEKATLAQELAAQIELWNNSTPKRSVA